MEKLQITIKRKQYSNIIKACNKFSEIYSTYDTNTETLKTINDIVDTAITCHCFPPLN